MTVTGEKAGLVARKLLRIRLGGEDLITIVEKSFWFIRTEGEPVDLKEDPEYKDQVTYSSYSKSCDLKISGVRESDSAVYKCFCPFLLKIKFSCSFPDAPQTPTVSLDPPTEILEGSSVTLTCSSDANPAANYTWFKENKSNVKMISGGPQFVFSSIHSKDSGDYFCEFCVYKSSNFPLLSPDAPKNISVSVNPPEILENSSVTLTCSSDANPAAKYTWFKKRNSNVKRISGGPQFVFSSIHSTDSGDYFCKVQNYLGLKRSDFKLEVKCEFFLFLLFNTHVTQENSHKTQEKQQTHTCQKSSTRNNSRSVWKCLDFCLDPISVGSINCLFSCSSFKGFKVGVEIRNKVFRNPQSFGGN
uniref:Ig-like domain-containing protein n=1 Tax=Oryzias melastigma TaxID=30732 RepID=A0A3B3BW63_ORYME